MHHVWLLRVCNLVIYLLPTHLQRGQSKAAMHKESLGVCCQIRVLTPTGGDLLAETDESANVWCIQCHEERGTEGSSEAAGSQVLDTAQPAGSLQCFQVGPQPAHSCAHCIGLWQKMSPQLTRHTCC